MIKNFFRMRSEWMVMITSLFMTRSLLTQSFRHRVCSIFSWGWWFVASVRCFRRQSHRKECYKIYVVVWTTYFSISIAVWCSVPKTKGKKCNISFIIPKTGCGKWHYLGFVAYTFQKFYPPNRPLRPAYLALYLWIQDKTPLCIFSCLLTRRRAHASFTVF